MSIKLVETIVKQLPKQGGSALSGYDLLSAWNAYESTRQVELTKRSQIEADRDVRLEAIRKQADIFHDLIQKTFAERGRVFEQSFSLLREGFENNNDMQINAALSMIVTQIKENPMAKAVDMMRQINDPNVKCIDI